MITQHRSNVSAVEAVLVPCRSCHGPIRDNSAACHFCGAPRNGVLRARVTSQRRPAVAKQAFSVPLQFGLAAKLWWVAAASFVAAALLWHHQYGELRTDWFVFQGITTSAVQNFGLALLVTLVPRATGLLLALLVVGTRTYLAWQA